MDFCYLSGCENLVHDPKHVHNNRLDIVMENVPHGIEVSFGSPLGSSDHCYVGWRLSVEQVLPVHNFTRQVRP